MPGCCAQRPFPRNPTRKKPLFNFTFEDTHHEHHTPHPVDRNVPERRLDGPARPSANPSFARQSRAEQAREQINNRLPSTFNAADANQDGKVTKAEAKGKMPRLYANFEKVDAQGQGYVTLEQVQAVAQKQLQSATSK
jgi:hypothetical protein